MTSKIYMRFTINIVKVPKNKFLKKKILILFPQRELMSVDVYNNLDHNMVYFTKESLLFTKSFRLTTFASQLGHLYDILEKPFDMLPKCCQSNNIIFN